MNVGTETLAARVRGEYREMPGLQLTLPQACRLWQLNPSTCEPLLQSLVIEGFLLKTARGLYVAAPSELRMRSMSSLQADVNPIRRNTA